MGLIAIPWLTLILYFLVGQRRFIGYVSARRSGDKALTAIVEQLNECLCHCSTRELEFFPEFNMFSHLTKIPASKGNRYRLLINGEEAFQSMFEAIEQSQHYIVLQFYIVRDDHTGTTLKNLLLRKLQQGVDIYFLYDDLGSAFLPNHYVTELENAGAKMASFNSLGRYLKRFQINFRNHRKILVCDGNCGFLGGLNVGDEYRGLSPKFSNWRDTHLKLTGPAVLTLQMAFLEDWYWATRTIPSLHWQPIANPSPQQQSASLDERSGVALILPTGPADKFETCELLYLSLIESARTKLWIASPYFVPDLQIMSALQLAALRGVDVRIMIPEKPDHKMVYYAAYTYLQKAEQFGIQILRYQTGFMHQKVILVDDRYASIGTANFDNRSMRLNFEVTALMIDPVLIHQVEAMLLKDFSHCQLMTSTLFKNRTFAFRLLCQTAKLMSPML